MVAIHADRREVDNRAQLARARESITARGEHRIAGRVGRYRDERMICRGYRGIELRHRPHAIKDDGPHGSGVIGIHNRRTLGARTVPAMRSNLAANSVTKCSAQ